MSFGPISIVDDHATNRQLARAVVTKAGYEVREASDAEEALLLIEAARPSLILMDLQLPGMSGLDLTRQIKADPRFREIPVLALAASRSGRCVPAVPERRERRKGKRHAG